ncbi:MAG TPA: SOUL heme-binding protein [Verrucomicrobiales bacterium]|nr:SOUL heme-binding protein [Verrucomicrobiales bacterium]
MSAKSVLAAAGLLTAAALLAGCKLTRWGYESPVHEVVHREGTFEIRVYPSIELASTPLDGESPQEGGTFMRLFRYISGANDTGQKIAMTVPVFSTLDEGEGRMSFVVPKDVSKNGAPPASDSSVSLETMPGGRFAVIRYSGSWSPERNAAARQNLVHWLAELSIASTGEALIANYDPPFTPPFLRRNEVFIRLPTDATAD